MRILITALVSLLALASLLDAPGHPLPAASGAEARRSMPSLLDGGGNGGGDDGGDGGDDDGDDDDDDEDVRAVG